MKFLDSCLRLFCQFKYPLSLPDEVALAIGMRQANFIPFDLLCKTITPPRDAPKALKKYMNRKEAEKVFKSALSRKFEPLQSHFSYTVDGTTVNFTLHFDQNERLRRLVVQREEIYFAKGIDIPLETSPFYRITESLLLISP